MARGLWRGPLPASLRIRLIASIMGGAATGVAARRLADGVAAGGASALAADPAAALVLVAALQARGASPILIAGDSHSRLYVRRGRRGGRWLLPLHHLATGASARGLARAASRSGEGERLGDLLAGVSAAAGTLPVLLVFGQVDVEFIFTFKRLEQDPPADFDPAAFDQFCRETAEAYADFASGLPMTQTLALAAIFPPALSDEGWRQGYLNAHIADQHTALEVTALGERLAAARVENLASRTAQHRAFNDRLRAAAQARGLGWLEALPDLIEACGVAGPEVLGRAAGRDHHLDSEAAWPAISKRLWTMIDAAPGAPTDRA